MKSPFEHIDFLGSGPVIGPKPQYYMRSGMQRGAWLEVREVVLPPGKGERADYPVILIAVHGKVGGYYLADFGSN